MTLHLRNQAYSAHDGIKTITIDMGSEGKNHQDHRSSHRVNKGHRSSRTLPFSPQSDLAAEPALVTCIHPELKMTGGDDCAVVKTTASGVRHMCVKDQPHH